MEISSRDGRSRDANKKGRPQSERPLQRYSVVRPERGRGLLPLALVLAPKGEVGNLLDVGASNLAILAKVSQHVRDTLIGEVSNRTAHLAQFLNGYRRIHLSQSRQNVSLETVILDLRLGGLARASTLAVQQFNLVVNESHHLSVISNNLANLSEHFLLSHNQHILSCVWAFCPFLYCTFIIAQSPLFVKWFFKIFLDWLSVFSSNQKALGSADNPISILLPFLYLVFIIPQAFWFVKRFFKIFFFFFVSLFPYLVNILQ